MKINEVAKLAGVTVRTLHYYDEIGLLKPSDISAAGYRLYNEKSLETLQQILFFRELDFAVNEIKDIITNPAFDRTEALLKQKQLLLKKRDHIDGLINLVDQTIKGEDKMSFQEFDMKEIEQTKQKYAAEVKERWGNTQAYAESMTKTNAYGKEQWQKITAETAAIFQAFSDKKDLGADNPEVQALAKRWQDFITDTFYECTDEILAGLGIMYLEDERFQNNIDQSGEGTAAFMSKAIAYYCASRR